MPDISRFDKSPASASLPTQVVEFKDLVVAYAKQETIDPLKRLGRFLAAGIAGAVLLSIGLVLLSMSLLRALQEETGSSFAGNLTWVPYLLTVAGALVVVGLAVYAIGKPKRRRSRT